MPYAESWSARSLTGTRQALPRGRSPAPPPVAPPGPLCEQPLPGTAGPARPLHGGDCCRPPAEAVRAHAASFGTAPGPLPGTVRRRPTTNNARSPFPRPAH